MLLLLLFDEVFFDAVLLLLEYHLCLWIGPFGVEDLLTLKASVRSQVTALHSILVVVLLHGLGKKVGVIRAGPPLLSLA